MMTVATPFPRRPIPASGESIYGFERRFAACTRYESLGAFREVTGLQEIVPGSSQAKFSRLAMLAGLEPTDLDFMRWTGRGGIRRGTTAVVLDHPVHAGYLRTQQLRFCPTCLAEDGPPEQRIHHQAWQVLQLCACPRHGTLLVERCDECAQPIEQAQKTKAWACACGREMTDMAASIAPSGAVSLSLTIMRRLERGSNVESESTDGHRPLSEAFIDLDLDSLLTVVSKLGMLAMTSPEADEQARPSKRPYTGAAISPDLTVAQIAEIMNAADPIVRDWSVAAGALFSSIADRNPAPAQRHPVHAMFATSNGHRLLGRIKSVDGTVIRVIDDALKDWLFQERGIYIDGRRRPKVSAEGDVAIDVADALRRLEGRSGNLLCISAWVDAGAVEMVGRKVSLASVDAAVEAISRLVSSDVEDSLSSKDWNTRFTFNEHYRRSDALRDVLSGRIRVKRGTDETGAGLASLRVCRQDLMRCVREATTSARLLKRSPEQRAKRARDRDAFYRPGQIYSLLEDLWPGRPLPYLDEHPRIRCKTKTWRYPDRELRQRFYSIADALAFMETRGA